MLWRCNMKCNLFTINYGDYYMLEIYDNDTEVYEYYLKNGSDFEFKFGVKDRFTQDQLTALADAGYFD